MFFPQLIAIIFTSKQLYWISLCKEYLFRFWPTSLCWGLPKEKLKSFSWKRFLLCFRLDGTCWGLITIPKYQTFWIGKYSITFCEQGCEQWYSTIDLNCERWLQHRLLSCGTGNTKHFTLTTDTRDRNQVRWLYSWWCFNSTLTTISSE